MYLDDGKSYLLFGKQINQIIMVLQMISDKYPDIRNINRFIQNLNEIMNDLQLRFMDERDKNNGKD